MNGEEQLMDMMLAGLRNQTDAELAALLRENPEFVRLQVAISNEAMARIVERLPNPPKKDPIEVRMTRAEHNFTAQWGIRPTRLELGPDEWREMKEWTEDLIRRGLLCKSSSPLPPHPTYRGIELHKHTRPGVTARQ